MKNKNHKTRNNRHHRNTKIEIQDDATGIPVPDGKSFLVLPLGGVGQIGMNWTLYGHAGKWVLVDAGSAFAPRDLTNVEAIVPDPEVIASILPRLQALIVTHAHEDHIGAIHRLWPTIRCPIYVTPFAREALKCRFEERRTDRRVRLRTFTPGDTLRIGPFNVQTIRMTHSAPECVSLAFRSSAGVVYHTGDWKFDNAPVIGKPTDVAAIRRLGKKGVLAMISDSTNSERESKLTNEVSVYQGFRRVFEDSRGMVVVSCFATNVARVASVLKAAAAANRQVAISGRSLIRYEKIARDLGLLDGIPEPLTHVRHLKGLMRREMVLLCTGAQGESNAALSRISTGDDLRLPKLEEGDTIVHSARVIPGNEDEIGVVFDRFRAMGVRILEREYRGRPLHVTGHATSGELRTMYEMVKPRFAIPVHGEDSHLKAHSDLALEMGVEATTLPVEGGVYRVSQIGITKVGQVEVRLVAELGDTEHSRVPWDEAALRAQMEAEFERRARDIGYDLPLISVPRHVDMPLPRMPVPLARPSVATAMAAH